MITWWNWAWLVALPLDARLHFTDDQCHMVTINLEYDQGRSYRGAMNDNAPTRLSGTPRISYPLMRSYRSEFSWYAHEAPCSQRSPFVVLGTPIKTQSRAGAPGASWGPITGVSVGAPVTRGSLALCIRLEKF